MDGSQRSGSGNERSGQRAEHVGLLAVRMDDLGFEARYLPLKLAQNPTDVALLEVLHF